MASDHFFSKKASKIVANSVNVCIGNGQKMQSPQ